MTRPPETEAQFQAAVIRLAHLRGWHVAHFCPAMNTRGRWMTPVHADGAGFPDLVIAKAGHAPIFAELKSARGRLTPAQVEWRDALGPHHQLWRPTDWDTAAHLLANPTEAPR